jgi:hypothetical protein
MSQFDFTEKMSGSDGGGRPRSYYYLWHLVALGVIDAEFGLAVDPDDLLFASAAPNITGTVWDEIGAAFPQAFEPAVVALIDVGVSRLHPNLRTRIDDRSIDLASHRYGAATQPADPANPHEREQEAPFFAGLDISGLGAIDLGTGDAAFLSALVGELATATRRSGRMARRRPGSLWANPPQPSHPKTERVPRRSSRPRWPRWTEQC